MCPGLSQWLNTEEDRDLEGNPKVGETRLQRALWSRLRYTMWAFFSQLLGQAGYCEG